MKKHINLTAYNDVENLKRFDKKSFKIYCDHKLKSCSKHIEFIRKYCIDKYWEGKICEIGSGNSKLLYRLEKENLLREGLGYEISQSRYRFAEKFKKYIKSINVINKNKDILDEKSLKNYDLIIGVDIVFELISPLYNEAESDLLCWIYDSIRPGGYLIFELWDFLHILKLIKFSDGNVLNIWDEFPKSDPFKYGLFKISLNEIKDIIWEKIYIKRNDFEESNFKCIIRPYKRNLICQKLKQHGFSKCRIFNKWSPGGGVKGEYIVLARKPL